MTRHVRHVVMRHAGCSDILLAGMLSILRRHPSYAKPDDQARERDHPSAGTDPANKKRLALHCAHFRAISYVNIKLAAWLHRFLLAAFDSPES
jgi:hypothetical protein